MNTLPFLSSVCLLVSRITQTVMDDFLRNIGKMGFGTRKIDEISVKISTKIRKILIIFKQCRRAVLFFTLPNFTRCNVICLSMRANYLYFQSNVIVMKLCISKLIFFQMHEFIQHLQCFLIFTHSILLIHLTDTES